MGRLQKQEVRRLLQVPQTRACGWAQETEENSSLVSGRRPPTPMKTSGTHFRDLEGSTGRGHTDWVLSPAHTRAGHSGLLVVTAVVPQHGPPLPRRGSSLPGNGPVSFRHWGWAWARGHTGPRWSAHMLPPWLKGPGQGLQCGPGSRSSWEVTMDGRTLSGAGPLAEQRATCRAQ